MITIIRVSDGMREVDFQSGMTVNTVLDQVGWELKDNEEVRVNGTPVNGQGLETPLRDLDTIVIVKPIAGN